jgi:DNA sulfur modification protein DndB
MGANQIESFTENRLATSRSERIAEYKKRKQAYDFVKVHPAEVEERKGQGWEFDRQLKTGVRLRRAKSSDEILENRFWSILYLIGFQILSSGRYFKLNIAINGKRIAKQIDVLGIDEDTVVVAECKSAESLKRKSLQSALAELDSLKRPIANAVRSTLGDNVNRKFIWCMVTSRIRWTDNDLARAQEKRIHVVGGPELRYFSEIAKTLGRAAKHQFEAEFLSGQRIRTFSDRTVPATRLRLGGRFAYSFTVRASELLRRAFVNHRDLRDPSGAPTYQRLINPGRIKSVASFLQNGGYFANSILINFHTTVRFDQQGRDEASDTRFGTLYLPDTYKSCWIIDGQHRLYGAALLEGESDDPIIPVIAFEKLPAAEEASLFATINKEQRQVQKRLLDELDGELKWDSDDPEEAARAIAARALDQLRHEIAGPFEDRFAPPGMPGEKGQVLTLPQVKQALLKSGLLGRKSAREGSFLPGPLTAKTNKKTLENVCDFLSSYFGKVRAANLARWEGGSAELLCYNPAIQAHIRLCGEVVRYLERCQKIDPHELDANELADAVIEFAKPLLDFIASVSAEEFRERFYVPFGSGGPARYFYRAAELLHRQTSDFEPEGLREFLAGTNKDMKDECDRLVPWITDAIHGHVVRKLREHYGNDFFNIGIKNKEIKKKAYEKSLDDPSGAKPLETYLDVIELKKIVESSENWPIFKDTLSISLPQQPKNLAKYVNWIEQFNEVRKIWAHPYGRAYSDEDLSLLRLIETELRKRLG